MGLHKAPLGNGVTEQFSYDAQRMQMTSQKAGTASPYTNRMNLTYGYSVTSGQMGVGSTAGNAAQLMSVSGTINGATESAAYTYDNYGRLVTSNQTSNGSSAQRRFAYDRWGNRTGVWDATSGGTQIQSVALVTSSSIPNNQIASVTTSVTVSYTYDNNGNVTSDGVHSYTYDSENRLVSVDSGSTASYVYDQQNRRYKKTVGSAVTHYIWQDGQVIAEHDGSTGAMLVEYIKGGNRKIAALTSGAASYFLNNRLSLNLTLDTSANISGQQSHLPFGEDFAESGTQQKQHFTSYERDSESNSDYAINRQYNSAVGRFLTADLYRQSGGAAAPQSWNRYTYVQGDPVNQVDRSGLLETTWDGEESPCEGSVLGQFFCDFEPFEDTPPNPIDPLPSPPSCNIDIITDDSRNPHLTWNEPARVPRVPVNSTPVGPGVIDNFDYYFYIVHVNITDGAGPSHWTFAQTKDTATSYIINRNGVSDTLVSRQQGLDGPISGVTQWDGNNDFYWYDTPATVGVNQVQWAIDPKDGKKYPVLGITAVKKFTYIAKYNGWPVCIAHKTFSLIHYKGAEPIWLLGDGN